MTTPVMRPIMVAPATEIGPLLRPARATVAGLALRVRSTRYQAERAELAGADDDKSAARAVLRASLAEMVAARSAALSRQLEDERRKAALVVDAARAQAARLDAALSVSEAQAREASVDPASARRAEAPSEPGGQGTADHAARSSGAPMSVAQLVQEAITAALPRVVAAAMVTTEPAAAGPPTRGAARRRFLRRFLHVDVALPLIAVLVVVVVLLAWVG